MFCDLHLVMSQVEGIYEAWDVIVAKYHVEVQRLAHGFSRLHVFQVLHEENT